MRLLMLLLFTVGSSLGRNGDCNLLAAQSSSGSFEIIRYNDVPYDGKRLYIGPLKITSNGDVKQYAYTISNTGRRDIRLGASDLKDVVIFLDPTFKNEAGIPDLEVLVNQILTKKKFLEAGDVAFDQSIFEQKEAPVVASSESPKTENEAESSTPKKEKKPKSGRPDPTPTDLGNGTTMLETPEVEGSERGKFLDKDNCPDLIIKDIDILKVNKFMIALEYTVKNQGTGTAYFHGDKNINEDNVYIQAHLSATPKFTRSAQLKGENPIKKEVGNREGSLEKTREFKGKMYLNVRGSTKLTPYLILNLDPYQTVRECNERNNRSFIRVDK